MLLLISTVVMFQAQKRDYKIVLEKLLCHSKVSWWRAWQDRVSQHITRPARPRPRPMCLLSDWSCLRPHHWTASWWQTLSDSVLTAIFQVNLGQPLFIEAKDNGGLEVVVTTGAISRAKLQSNHHHQQTNIQAGCPSCHPTNSVKALKAKYHIWWTCLPQAHLGSSNFVCDH